MITKFEKRVIAFLLAALMCCPVTAFSAVTVNAEETQDTEQQETQSDALADGTVAQDDAAAGDSASDVQQDVSSEGQSVNDLSDGAFIPIQEEPYEEAQDETEESEENAAAEAQQRAEEEYAAYAAQRAAESDVPDEELEKVALGENGEPARMTTDISESEGIVRYLFQPEESGAYYLDVIGQGGFSVYEKTDDGEEYVGSGTTFQDYYASEVFVLESRKTYYIDITYEYGAAGTVEWKLGQPQDITPGTYEAVISEPGEKAHYRLVYGETDLYYFEIDGNGRGWVSIQDGSSEYSFSYDAYRSLDKAQDCFIDIYYDDVNDVGTLNLQVSEVFPQEVKEGESIHTVTEAGGQEPVYRFVPQGDGQYRVTYSGATIYDADCNYIGNSMANLEAGETYYIVMPSYQNQQFDWSIKRPQEIEIQEGETIHTAANEVDYYKFVPIESGRYSVSANNVTIYDKDWSWYGNSSANLTEGETYYIVINSSSAIDWNISKLQEIELQEGQPYHVDASQRVYFKFVPTENGRYAASASVTIYDAGWNWFASGEAVLTAGTTYYIVLNSFYSVDFSMSKLQEIEIKADVYYRVDAGKSVYFKFVPEESAEYDINDSRMYLYNSSWSNLWNYNLEAGQTYYLKPRSSSTNFYFCVKKAVETPDETERIPVQAGGTYVTVPAQGVRYTFVPEETGRYHFWSDTNANIMLDFPEDYRWYYGFSSWIDLDAGTEYEILLSSSNGNDQEDITWHIEKAGLTAIQAGTEYTTVFGQPDEYEFTPVTTGYYLLESDDLGECEIYDSSRSELNSYSYNMYDYIDDTGFGSTVYLEKDQTYYFHIIPNEDKAEWQINAVEKDGEYWYRRKADGTVEILKYLGSDSSVVIPETIDGAEVGSIGFGAFSKNEQLETVTIPSKVTALQYGAFESCSNLKDVTFAEGSSLQSVGDSAFKECGSLENINLPDTVEEIETRSFYSCSALWEINLGSQLEEIGQYAFYNTGLERVDIPDRTQEIGVFAFSSITALQEVTIGNSLDGIETGMFINCENLSAIQFPSNITYIGNSAFNNTGLTTVDIPDTVTSVGISAFTNCKSLQEVNIGSSVTYIADSAFSGCDLKDLTIGGKVESIGMFAFSSSQNLESVVIPNSVTEIEYGAFQNCRNLLEIEIPDSVEAIGGFVFDSMNSSNNTAWYDSQEDGVVYAGKVLYKYKGTAPEGTAVTIEDGTKGIAGYAFYWQYGMTEAQLPNTVTNIGDYAFLGCEKLTEIQIPQSVTEIGEGALGYLDADGLKVEGFTIYGVAGSAAQQYAEENGFEFIEVEPEYTLGDVDANGSVDISDLRLVLRAVCGKTELTDNQKLAADVEKDNDVNIQDLRKILRYVCRKIDSFE